MNNTFETKPIYKTIKVDDKKELEAKRKDDIKGMSKSEIAEYDNNKKIEEQMERIKNLPQGSGPKHMLSQG